MSRYTRLGGEPSKGMGILQTYKTVFIGLTAAVLIFLVVLLAVVLPLKMHRKKVDPPVNYGFYKHAAVAADHITCSELGRDILLKNGTAVDAAIASMYCTCTFNLQSCGIGGGFFMMVYQRSKEGSEMMMREINARETAPLGSTPHMFQNRSSTKGGLAVGVPGQVKGSYAAWKLFGRLPWKDLMDPTIKWLKEGFVVNFKLGKSIELSEEHIRNSRDLANLFVKKDGSLVKEGDTLKLPRLAATMEKIAEDPEDFYTGELAKDIALDIQDANGIVSLNDLNNYEAHVKYPYNATIPGIGLTLHSISPPGSGPVLAFMLKIIDAMNLSTSDLKNVTEEGNTYQRLVESMKFAYAAKTYLGDDRFVDVSQVLETLGNQEHIKWIISRISLNTTHPIEYYLPADMSSKQDHGTSHLSVLAPDGSAAAITSTINTGFGAGFIGNRTGILFNNEMDDFTIPDIRTSYGITNLVQPGKRPMSSMIPSIYTDMQGRVRFVMGGSGGPTITTSNFYSMAHRLWLGYTIENAINKPRLHHQLFPHKITYEEEFSQDIVKQLILKKHQMYKRTTKSMSSDVQGIENQCDADSCPISNCITAVSDLKRKGKPTGF